MRLAFHEGAGPVGNLRTYGNGPFSVAVVHGGPGAAGEMASVARELASVRGVLEPLQTAASLGGQVEELRAVLEEHGDLPATLIGFSWGAWLCYMTAALYPAVVKKLILVASGPYEERYAAGILETRLSRLSAEDRADVRRLMVVLDNPAAEGRNAALARFGALLAKADAYDPVACEPGGIQYDIDVFQGVWRDAAGLRRSGRLLELGKRIDCPVVAIHGDYDPHPAQGVREPLSSVLRDFRFVLLRSCGHRPWMERQARDEFYRVLGEELG